MEYTITMMIIEWFIAFAYEHFRMHRMEMEMNDCCCHCESSDECIGISKYLFLFEKQTRWNANVRSKNQNLWINIIIFGYQIAEPVHTYIFRPAKRMKFLPNAQITLHFDVNLKKKPVFESQFFPSFFHFFIGFCIRNFLCLVTGYGMKMCTLNALFGNGVFCIWAVLQILIWSEVE